MARTCPQCGKPAPEDFRYCEYCGFDFTKSEILFPQTIDLPESENSDTAQSSQTASGESENEQKCPECGNPISEGSNYCEQCGFDFTKSAVNENSVSNSAESVSENPIPIPIESAVPRKKKRHLILIAFAAILVIVGIFTIFQPSYTESASPNTTASKLRFVLTLDDYLEKCAQNIEKEFPNTTVYDGGGSGELNYMTPRLSGEFASGEKNILKNEYVCGYYGEYSVTVFFESDSQKVLQVHIWISEETVNNGQNLDWAGLLYCLWEPLSGKNYEECTEIISAAITNERFIDENDIVYMAIPDVVDYFTEVYNFAIGTVNS
ncbi:MAG TPA: zinc ribbon domain-containing protein [Candidatus Gallacutalibacter pullicola]|uniref:Zinc ribbon domain-containing protein n=1 Tax=Candidatus Gallacutalibacter pullicola TaxID=2840830 RepID=A0A9D1DPS1_9FIRM|nr:zinc ribbon domain-containing protein [Candidatus Gallacutalibacter pullicola]